MLQHSGKVFFRVTLIDRVEGQNPKVYLDLYERDSQRLIGQMRFNFDPTYSKKKEDIRMSFDVLKTSMISPVNGGSQLLEDIVVGGILWLIKDNHYTYPFVPNVYMVIHSYVEDEKVMKDINHKIIEILLKIGAEKNGNMLKISEKEIEYDYVAQIINRD